METTHDQPGIHMAAVKAGARPAAAASGFDWGFILLASWMVGGVFLDGWAHTHGKVDQSFFTPWHAVLYSGYLAVAIFLVITLARTHAQGVPWRRAYPAGYGSSIVGAAIFAVAGVGDLLWHTLFGIEKGIEGEISPSHLALALGAVLMLSGPLRAAWRRTAPDAARRWSTLLSPLLALTYIFSLLVFFTQFADPIVHSRADLDITQITIILNPFDVLSETDLSTKLGVASILLQAAIMTGVVLFVIRRWRLPIGSFALIFGLNGLLVSVLAGSAPIIEVGILSALIGLLIDLLNTALRPSPERVLALRVFAFAVPFLNNVIYFAVLYALKGSIAWSVHLWTGSIVMAGIVGLLLSYLLVPPQVAGEA
jgi:hypothetical protein